METQPIKIAVDQEMADIFKQPTGEDGNAEAYDLHMGILELSVSLRNINHDVEKSHGKDPEERTLHETRGDLFMRLYKELVDIEPDEIKRCEYLTFFYDLFESVKPKLSGLQESFTYRMELIDRMHGQVQCILERLSRTQNAKEISSASKVNIYLESKMVPNESTPSATHERNINIGERQRVPNGRQDCVAGHWTLDSGQWTLAITVAAVVRATLFLLPQDITAQDVTPFHNSP
ncbi:uncharacterized protein LOC26526481 [Drosophila erecta]|uniref:uncharacterized protein LOC26526481 n=1 Tax=Drosophila erecta TaxID=7220 RepID=UPI000F062A9A|nr:uncharacterized protein LOC26526481 [Drosophila erecta]